MNNSAAKIGGESEDILKEQLEAVKKEHGPWTGHNIWLSPTVSTITTEVTGQELRLQRFFQAFQDILGEDFSKLRVLDLASLEGIYSIEFARKGATVVTIEGREQNAAKIRFVKEQLQLSNLSVVVDDIRNISREKLGGFDVILCAGILYHLTAQDAAQVVTKISEMTDRIALFDTHISSHHTEIFTYKGKEYQGSLYREFNDSATDLEKLKNVWASLDNTTSFWFSRASLLSLLRDSGFSSVLESVAPFFIYEFKDRPVFIAFKGREYVAANAPSKRVFTDINYSAYIRDVCEARNRYEGMVRSGARKVKQTLKQIYRLFVSK